MQISEVLERVFRFAEVSECRQTVPKIEMGYKYSSGCQFRVNENAFLHCPFHCFIKSRRSVIAQGSGNGLGITVSLIPDANIVVGRINRLLKFLDPDIGDNERCNCN